MTKREHSLIFLIATLAWAGIWVAGLPSYYQQYSNVQMVWFDSLALVPMAAVIYLVLRRLRPERRLTVALWLAWYFTVPLALYDWLYCGLYLGHGVEFLFRYWYLTVYYAAPWVLLPPMVLFLNRTRL